MKRLRKKFGPNIRYFHCGEYGENFGRPHYHACLFNHDFKDKIHWKTVNDQKLFVSKTLEELWPFGFSTIGDVTFESAAYVARYVTKKVTGEKAIHHYNDINYETGEILQERKPEYVTMSRRPGIGKPWLEKFKTDVFQDSVVLRGKELRPPKFYISQIEQTDPDVYKKIKNKRLRAGKENAHNNTRDRLDVRETIQLEKLKQLKRVLK